MTRQNGLVTILLRPNLLLHNLFQAYFKQKGTSQLSTSGSKDEEKGEEISSKNPIPADLETPTLDAILETQKPPVIASAKPLWGANLNKKEVGAKPGALRRHKTESAISRVPSFSGIFNDASQSSQQTR